MEYWKPIRDFEDYYEVSNLGRVRRIKSYNNSPVGRILKHKYAGAGYSQVHLSKENKYYPRYVHRLVADAFLGGLSGDLEVNHKDCVKTNNRFDNLEICDRSHNNKHAISNGLRKAPVQQGMGHWKASIDDDTVRKIRKVRNETKLSQREIGLLFGVSRDVVNNIVTGRQWKHVT